MDTNDKEDSILLNSNDPPKDTEEESHNVNDETTKSTPASTSKSLFKKRRHVRSDFQPTPTENLLQQQVDTSKEQLQVMKEILLAFKERNEIEAKKLKLMEEKS